ncbi:hypothetical protein O3P69_011617 [Scylla paramamosain]|uniref:Uncharacterized protein n=1 Tax=Scylla paramamosain TaxID=85552 RepID=A0AAW0T8N2_SCYPA
MTVKNCSEAEDMVRLAAFAANVNNDIRGDKKSLMKLGLGDPREVKSDIFTNNYLKTNVDYTMVCTDTLFKNPATTIDIYSFDSDVIVEWDSLVRHAAKSPRCLGGGGVNDDDLRARMKKMAGNIKFIFFFRSLVNRGVEATSREDSRAIPTAFTDGSDDYDLLTLSFRQSSGKYRDFKVDSTDTTVARYEIVLCQLKQRILEIDLDSGPA